MPPLPPMPDGPGLIFALSGPSGSGKTTLCDELLAAVSRARRLVTCTSRDPRPGEQQDVDYHFLSAAEFEAALARGEFFEHALVHGFHYGSRRRDVLLLLDHRHDVILNIDVQGAATLRQTAAEEPMLAGRLVTIFLYPPPPEELRQRLLSRSQDKPEAVEKRLLDAVAEVARWREFDYLMPSGTRAEDFSRLLAIYHAERLRLRPASPDPAEWKYTPAQ